MPEVGDNIIPPIAWGASVVDEGGSLIHSRLHIYEGRLGHDGSMPVCCFGDKLYSALTARTRWAARP